ncbi:hypothetical protein APUTEX25_003303 [Auxenochlorella protothecoides]|uniref:Uncharacterized protein n=1 Tax=Auxenochlorella protothecoides TaxID=3075 RepID=A0A3M7KSH7_AUXPR|nr:hypothetical protein APUTEX25_003303 [Auxenochlorella protothecoides]|eukprot:RMZ53481.1 hypothetical protein APUTEX25_003303 [Auxenochlorella protothecoides]
MVVLTSRGTGDASELVGLPEHCEEVLKPPPGQPALCLAFNPSGTLLATGCAGGDILIWNYQTRALVRTWKDGHNGAVRCLVWSPDGHSIMSGGADGSIVTWDVLSGRPTASQPLGRGAVVSLCPGPGPGQLLLTFRAAPPAVLTVGGGGIQHLPLAGWSACDPPEAPEPAPAEATSAGAEAGKDGRGGASLAEQATSSGYPAATAPGSALIYAAMRGALLVVRASDLAIIDAIRVQAALRVSSLELDPGGTRLIVLANDRAVRVYAMQAPAQGLEALPARDPGEVEALVAAKTRRPSGSIFYEERGALLRPSRRFEQQIERNTWSAATFSGDGEYVLAAVAGQTEHVIYAWNSHYGHTDRVLECESGIRGAHGVLAMAWHPQLYPMQLLTLGGSGSIFIWTKILSDKWTAFAPDFRELEENEEYIEREDEFDVVQRAATPDQSLPANVDADLDIVTRGPSNTPTPASSDLLFLPVVIQAESDQGQEDPDADAAGTVPNGGATPMDEDDSDGGPDLTVQKRARPGVI